jgi:nitrite reductase/ring-hydroxylating ferredoxin subunit
MERRTFLSTLGIGAAFALTATCIGGCTKDSVAAVTTTDFTLNLDDAANATLKTNGGYVISNNCVVARDTSGNYVAATVICSHEQKKQVIYDKTQNNYRCTAHDALFSLSGQGLNSKGSGGLTIYKTTLTGNLLRVYA